jgi:tetratricopeptide (TPR) repeat protein
LLVIGTYRPVEMLSDGHPLKNITQELYAYGSAFELAVGVLSEAAIEAYLEEHFAVGAHRCAPLQSLGRTLHARTDGNLLFLVALVNDLVEHGVLTPTATGWELKEEAATVESTIPDSIRHLVALQRERLSSTDQVLLEAASVAGMEFSTAAVAAALTTDIGIVERRCEQLAECQQFLKRLGVEEWPDGTLAARYGFLHALYQQLWHERVTPVQLQRFHLQIGERKEQAYGERAREIATELAIHFEQGREFWRAVQYHGLAGQQALQRSAAQEAIAHLSIALDLLRNIPASSERTQQEMSLHMALGFALMNTKGYAAPEVEHAYAQARALSEQLEDTPQLFSILIGLTAFYATRSKLQHARELSEHSLTIAQHVQDLALLLEAHRSMGHILFCQGNYLRARSHLEQAFSFYDREQHHTHAFLYGHNPGVFCLMHLAAVLWGLGYLAQAAKKSHEAIMLAREVGHPFTLAAALNMVSLLHIFHGEIAIASSWIEEEQTIATEHGFAFFMIVIPIHRAYLLAQQGQSEASILPLCQALVTFRSIGMEIGYPSQQALLAEVYGKAGQAEEGLSVLAEALAQVDKTGDRFYEAELYRLKGELTLQKQLKVASHKSQVEEAETCFLKAIEIARKQQAKMFELRATVSLARLWQQQGKRHEARQRLAEIYGWFTEGFDTVDLKEAKALLEELG